MKQRITFLTLGVDDLHVSLRFYREGLGLETEGIIGTEFESGGFSTQCDGILDRPQRSLGRGSG